MNKKIIIGALVVCLLAFVAVFTFAQNIPRNAERWEYMETTILNITEYNRLGAEGWEWVSGHPRSNSIIIFKRRLP